MRSSSACSRRGHDLEVAETTRRGHAPTLARDAADRRLRRRRGARRRRHAQRGGATAWPAPTPRSRRCPAGRPTCSPARSAIAYDPIDAARELRRRRSARDARAASARRRRRRRRRARHFLFHLGVGLRRRRHPARSRRRPSRQALPRPPGVRGRRPCRHLAPPLRPRARRSASRSDAATATPAASRPYAVVSNSRPVHVRRPPADAHRPRRVARPRARASPSLPHAPTRRCVARRRSRRRSRRAPYLAASPDDRAARRRRRARRVARDAPFPGRSTATTSATSSTSRVAYEPDALDGRACPSCTAERADVGHVGDDGVDARRRASAAIWSASLTVHTLTREPGSCARATNAVDVDRRAASTRRGGRAVCPSLGRDREARRRVAPPIDRKPVGTSGRAARTRSTVARSNDETSTSSAGPRAARSATSSVDQPAVGRPGLVREVLHLDVHQPARGRRRAPRPASGPRAGAARDLGRAVSSPSSPTGRRRRRGGRPGAPSAVRWTSSSTPSAPRARRPPRRPRRCSPAPRRLAPRWASTSGHRVGSMGHASRLANQRRNVLVSPLQQVTGGLKC